MQLETQVQRFRKVRATNATDASFPARVPKATKPTGIGDSAAQATASAVFELGESTGQNLAIIAPYGAGSDTNTFSMRVFGWSRVIEPGDPQQDIWVPVFLIEVACTLTSAQPGLANKTVNSSQLFCDAISLTAGNAGVSAETLGQTDTAGQVVIDMKGAELLEIVFSTGSSATSCNALVRFY